MKYSSYYWRFRSTVLAKERQKYTRLSPEAKRARWAKANARRDERLRQALPVGDWREIEGFPAYQINSEGMIRRVLRGAGTRIGHIQRHQITKKGYRVVSLTNGPVSKTMPVHRLIALAFIGPPPSPTHQVNHKDGNKANNTLANLEWATASEQMLHARQLGLIKPHVSNRSLSDDDVREVRRLLALGTMTQQAIADRFGVWQATVAMIKSGRTWSHLK